MCIILLYFHVICMYLAKSLLEPIRQPMPEDSTMVSTNTGGQTVNGLFTILVVVSAHFYCSARYRSARACFVLCVSNLSSKSFSRQPELLLTYSTSRLIVPGTRSLQPPLPVGTETNARYCSRHDEYVRCILYAACCMLYAVRCTLYAVCCTKVCCMLCMLLLYCGLYTTTSKH